MIVAGVDIGAHSVKAVLMRDSEIVAKSCIVIGGAGGDAAERAIADVLAGTRVRREDITCLVATGIGKDEVSFADRSLSDMSCHVRGAQWCLPSVRTVIDIGAENCRVSKCDDRGALRDFVMNNKCASGTGVFLETMARMMEVKIEEMGALSVESSAAVAIASTCAVFAESEVVGQVHRGARKADIIRGVHESLAVKVVSMLKQVGIERDVVMTGGVAKNTGAVGAIERQAGVVILVPDDPQVAGALGAALWARQELEDRVSV